MSAQAPQSIDMRRAPYFHLLWDHELAQLRSTLGLIISNRSQVIGRWYELYVLHFGDKRSLSEAEFSRIFETALTQNLTDLLEQGMDAYAADVRRLGEMLASRGVPFHEVIASAHLFEQSVMGVAPQDSPAWVELYESFDKLSHIRVVLLADAYFRSQSALAGARIQMLEREVAQVPRPERTSFYGLVGKSAPMRRLYERIEAAAATRGTILIVGKSGTGKELVARVIHECSPARNKPFVAFNCSAIPRTLIESELFGYKRGAFTGAASDYLGLLRAAQGGTLLLDEVTEMSPETQSKLLRALQEHTVRPVGSTSEAPFDARVIASTNRDPEAAVREGVLREDLYYRLQASVIHIEPLKERLEDVPILVQHFIGLFNQDQRREIRGISDRALAAMCNYSWPGNVRELSNAIEGAFTFGRSSVIRLEDLPPTISRQAEERPPAPSSTEILTFNEVERDTIRRALQRSGGNKSLAARMLQISRKKLYTKIAKYALA